MRCWWKFSVDAGRAGFGNLEMAIKDSEGVIIPSHVAQLETGTAKFLVTFNPTTVGMHTVNITFNKEVLRSQFSSFFFFFLLHGFFKLVFFLNRYIWLNWFCCYWIDSRDIFPEASEIIAVPGAKCDNFLCKNFLFISLFGVKTVVFIYSIFTASSFLQRNKP